MQGLFICIIIVLGVAFLEILLGIIFKGVKWLICFVLEFILFAFILFFLFGKLKLLLSLVATIVLNIIVLVKKIKGRNEFYVSDNYPPDFVLNKRTGVIHERRSHSAKTIKDEHRVEISSSTANELIRSGKNYRYKQ